jgi:ketosteroid isomerase-like protein
MRLQRVLLLPALLVFLAPPASAQQWSAAEREVVAGMKQCWDTWQQAVEAKDYDVWAPCMASDAVRFWWTEWLTPNSTTELRRQFSRGLFDWGMKRWDWVALRPVAITMEGDNLALVYFNAHWQNETTEGQVNSLEQRRFEVWKKIEGKWKQLGGMATPAGE